MERSGKEQRARKNKENVKNRRKVVLNIIRTGFIILLSVMIPAIGHGSEKGKIAVLPFKIHSLEPLEHLQLGLQKMFAVRMSEKGYWIINPDVVNKHPLVSLPAFEEKDIIVIGKELEADWLIAGSLTQIGTRVSIDLQVTDITGKRTPFSVFMVEDDIDMIPSAAERAATSIYNQISGVVQIELIQVEGNRRIESDAILAVIESKKGEGFNQEKLDMDLRAVYKMGYFTEVNTEVEEGATGKIITFRVSEKASIGTISFSGNKKVKENDLQKELGIKRYSILNMSEVKQSINRLKEYYRLKGYYNVNIEEKVNELPNNEVALEYVIDEGEKVYISKIEFIGNKVFDDDDLKDIMETSEKGFLSWFTKSGVLDEKKLEFDIQKVVSYYHNRGYIRAKAGEPSITYKENEGLIITTEIIEGDPYKVGKINLQGDLIRPSEELLASIKTVSGGPFNREILRNDMLKLRNSYADEGFAYAEIAPITKEDDEKLLVDITFQATKNKLVRFERINISGNSVTRDKVIRRELKVVEGDFYSKTKLDKGTRNLYRLGFFEDLEVNTREGSKDDLMILDINVKEQPTGLFNLGVGYSTFDKTVGMFQISQNNLFGKGQKLSGSVMLGSRTQEFDINFIEPWLFDKNVSAGISVYKWEREYFNYTRDAFGSALTLGFPFGFDDFTRGRIRYGYENSEVSDIDPASSSLIKSMKGRNLTSSLTFGITRDSKDRPWNTREGSLNSISIEYAGGFLGGDSYFTKYQAQTAWFFPLKWDTVFMVRLKGGYVTRRSGGVLPLYEKFALGGIDSVRGYEYGTISPIDPKTGDEIGGEKMWLYNIEYRFPLFREQGIVGVVFFDAGNTFKKEDKIKFEARRSVGTGVRWYSPIGPLRLEYGWKLDRFSGESSGEWEFTVGGMF